MPEHVVEDVRLLNIFQLLRLANEVASRKTAIGEVVEKDIVRDQAGNGDNPPAGKRLELI